VAISGTRATDTDRNNTCQVLDSALAEGQLSMEEHRQRVSAATNAITLGELQSLVSDLQIHRVPARLRQSTVPTRVWGIAIAAVVAVVLLGAGIGWALFGTSSSPSSSSSSASSASSASSSLSSASRTTSAAAASPTNTSSTKPAPPQLLTLSGISGVLAQMRSKFGDTLAYQLNIYPEHAFVYRPDTADARKTVEWDYRGGSWTTSGSGDPFSFSAVGDVSKFDVQAIVGVLQTAPQLVHIYDAGPNDVFLSVISTKDGSLDMQINVDDDSLSGSVKVAPDGTVLQVSPGAR
jgi:Domain of unknown function (DUF1707)